MPASHSSECYLEADEQYSAVAELGDRDLKTGAGVGLSLLFFRVGFAACGEAVQRGLETAGQCVHDEYVRGERSDALLGCQKSTLGFHGRGRDK